MAAAFFFYVASGFFVEALFVKNHLVKDPISFLADAGFFRARDGLQLRWYMDFPPVWKEGDPLLLLLSGRAESLDKYDRVTSFFLEEGLAVFRMDWRGQGGSGRLLAGSEKGHIDDFATYISDLEEILTQVILPRKPGKLIFCGHSLGGHLILRFLLGGGKMDAAILVSPMLSIYTGMLPENLARPIIDFFGRSGLAEQKIPGRRWLDKKPRFARNRLTRDPEHFYRFRNFLAEHPALETREPTWAWVHEAFSSMDKVWRDLELAPIEDVPLLILSGGKDRVVKPRDHARLLKFLKNGTCHFLPEARHELLMEKREVIREIWRVIEEFFRKYHILTGKEEKE